MADGLASAQSQTASPGAVGGYSEAMLRLEQISKRYRRPDGSTVGLDDVSLELERGQIMGIFGPSGAGRRRCCGSPPACGRRTAAGHLQRASALTRCPQASGTRFRRREIACVWAAQPWQERLERARSRRDAAARGRLRPSQRRAAGTRGAAGLRGRAVRRHGAAASSPTASASAWRSPARSSSNPGCCSPTARRRTSRWSSRRGSWCCSPRSRDEAKVAVLITDSDAEALLRARPDPLSARRQARSSPEPISERGKRLSASRRPGRADAAQPMLELRARAQVLREPRRGESTPSMT